MPLAKKVILGEVGLRDGLQNEKTLLSVEQKLGLIEELTDAGHTVIEVGSFMHPEKVPQMADTDEVFRRLKRKNGVEYRGMVANMRGVDRAVACGCKKIRMSVSASSAHNLANFNCTPEATAAGFADMCKKAEDNGLELTGGIMMVFGSPWESEILLGDVKKIIDSFLNLGINEISVADSAGLAAPDKIYETCSALRDSYPQVRNWILHLHNTRGMGMSNMLAGMWAGINCFDTSFAGLGGCPFIPGATGNLSTEDVLHMFDLMNIETGVNLDGAIAVGKKVAGMMGKSESYILRAGKSRDLIRDIPTGQIKPQTRRE